MPPTPQEERDLNGHQLSTGGQYICSCHGAKRGRQIHTGQGNRGNRKTDFRPDPLQREDITGLSITERAKLGISYAFQQPVRFKGITVIDLIRLAAGRNLKFSEACEYLSQVGLCAKDYIMREVNASLSGGELKRIEIATIIARGTKVSLFDEPEAGIDLWSFQNLIRVFENLHNTLHGSILIISHQERILNIADKIIVIADGTVTKEGSRDEILPELLSASNAAYGACSRLEN
mgnify:CR=1 FL=1